MNEYLESDEIVGFKTTIVNVQVPEIENNGEFVLVPTDSDNISLTQFATTDEAELQHLTDLESTESQTGTKSADKIKSKESIRYAELSTSNIQQPSSKQVLDRSMFENPGFSMSNFEELLHKKRAARVKFPQIFDLTGAFRSDYAREAKRLIEQIYPNKGESEKIIENTMRKRIIQIMKEENNHGEESGDTVSSPFLVSCDEAIPTRKPNSNVSPGNIVSG